MNHIILYAIEIVLCSGFFLALYRLLIQRKAGYTFCRRYLVVTLILAAVIPAFDVPVYVEKAAPAEAAQPAPVPAPTVRSSQISQIPQTSQIIRPSQAVQEIVPSAPASDPNVVAPSFRMNWNALAVAVYLVGLLVSLALMLRSYIIIARLKKGSRLSREDGYELAQNDDVESPFSFGKTIFMGRVSSDSERRQILSHEMSHIGHHHTQEKLLMSAIRSCLWFNPFAWLQERHLEEVQEWQADADVLAHGFNVDDYRNTILKTLLGVNPAATSGLNSSFTKKRMQQMGTEENHGHAAMVSLAAIALTAVCFCLFSLNVQARPVISTDHIKAGDIISGVVSDSNGPVVSGNVVERNATGQIVAHSITDEEGRFTLQIVDPKDSIEVTYVGLSSVILPVDRLHYEIRMESQRMLIKGSERRRNCGPIENRNKTLENLQKYAPEDYSCGYVITDGWERYICSIFLAKEKNGYSLVYNKSDMTEKRSVDSSLARKLEAAISDNIVRAVTPLNDTVIVGLTSVDIIYDGDIAYAVTPAKAAYFWKPEALPDDIWQKELEKFEEDVKYLHDSSIVNYAVVGPSKLKAGDMITGTVSNSGGPLMIVNVLERDNMDRVVASEVTDDNGRFSFTLVNPDDYIEFSYIGYKTVKQKIDRPRFNVTMNVDTNAVETLKITDSLLVVPDRVDLFGMLSQTSDSLDSLMEQMQKSMREPITDSPEAGGTVNGHVLDIDGNPIRNRTINVCERDLVGRAVTMGSASGDDGFFSLFNIRSPENHLAIEAEGYESQNLPLDRGTFEVRLKPAPVTLKPGDVVRGSVTCSQKTGPFTALHTAIGAKVEEVDRNGNVVASVLTDENGFSLTIVNPRDRLVISTDGYTPVSTSIEIRNYSFTLHKIQ